MYDKQVAELAQRLLKKDAAQKDGGSDIVVDESMFVQIDSSAQKDPVAPREADGEKTEERVKDEL